MRTFRICVLCSMPFEDITEEELTHGVYVCGGCNMSDYERFIESKRRTTLSHGFKPKELNPNLFDWQAKVVDWAIRRGRAALFEECGLGKTLQQLEWSRHVVEKTGRPVVIHCPVGVRRQTLEEAKKFGIDVAVAITNEPESVIEGINLINYEKMHNFDASVFGGVVLDESSILKNFTGKIRKHLTSAYRDTEFRLACTATPAPNDHMELGTHAEFLGVCERTDMLNMYFTHDGSDTSKWRLKGHAVKHFWEWVSSWAVCVSRPSDIGGSDDGFELPELKVNRHHVEPVETAKVASMLFDTGGISATNIHTHKRETLECRTDRAAELVQDFDGLSIVWCDTNAEADRLQELLPDAIEVRGNDSEKAKEDKLLAFSNGDVPAIITKPSIAGFGMNWQHCNHQVFAGLTYSFEAYYQAVRRCWRFGQEDSVTIDIVVADNEVAVESAIARKESDFQLMRSGMAEAVSDAGVNPLFRREGKENYQATQKVILPRFMG